jgi:hypothetical protein
MSLNKTPAGKVEASIAVAEACQRNSLLFIVVPICTGSYDFPMRHKSAIMHNLLIYKILIYKLVIYNNVIYLSL